MPKASVGDMGLYFMGLYMVGKLEYPKELFKKYITLHINRNYVYITWTSRNFGRYIPYL